MKLSPTEMDETIILVKKGTAWECRYFNRLLGCQAIGPRLARKDPYPDIPLVAHTKMEGNELVTRWQAWLDARPERSSRKGKSPGRRKL
jgi:hypothetical protein